MTTDIFQLDIISAEKKVFSGKVNSLVAPGISGLFGVFANHAPMITALKAGEIEYKQGADEHRITVEGGVVEVKHNVVTICLQ